MQTPVCFLIDLGFLIEIKSRPDSLVGGVFPVDIGCGIVLWDDLVREHPVAGLAGHGD